MKVDPSLTLFVMHLFSMYANPDVWCYLSSGQVSHGFLMDDAAPLVDETTAIAVAAGSHPP